MGLYDGLDPSMLAMLQGGGSGLEQFMGLGGAPGSFLPNGLKPITPPYTPGPTGLAAFLARPGLSQALMSTGAALMAQSDRPGTTLGALGRALPVGMEAYQQGQQNAQTDALIQQMPPQMQALLRSLPPAQRAQAMFSLAMPKPGVVVKTDERLVNPTTGQTMVGALPPNLDFKPLADGTIGAFDPRTGQQVRPGQGPAEQSPMEKEWALYSSLSPADQKRFNAMKAAGANVVNVNTAPEGAASAAVGKMVGDTIGGAAKAQENLNTINTIDQITSLVNSPAFKQISGPLAGSSLGQLAARLGDNPQVKELLGQFNALGSTLTMEKLNAFTGRKTEFEYKQAKRMAMNDTTMTPEEITAGLRIYKQIAQQDANNWAEDMTGLDLKRLNVNPADVARPLDLARRIKNGGVPAASADPLGIRK